MVIVIVDKVSFDEVSHTVVSQSSKLGCKSMPDLTLNVIKSRQPNFMSAQFHKIIFRIQMPENKKCRASFVSTLFAYQASFIFIFGSFNPLYTGGLFHYYILEESICYFRGVRCILSLLIIFLMENPVSKHCRP